MNVDLDENNTQVLFLMKEALNGNQEEALNAVFEVFLDIVLTCRESNKQLMKLDKINRKFLSDPKYKAIVAKLAEYWKV
jgi:hypothetical protein